MRRAFGTVAASGRLPATATRPSTSSSGAASASRIATASSMPGSGSMVIGRGIPGLISGLEERGFIRRLAHRARALEVIKLPEDAAAPMVAAGGERGRFSPTVIRGDFAAVLPGAPVASDSEAVELPLYGRIAA